MQKTIFFDVDGTLIDHIEGECRAARAFREKHADRFPESPDAFVVRWHEVAERHFDRYLAGEIPYIEQRRERIRELFADEGPLPPERADEIFLQFLALYQQGLELYDDVLPCLDALKGRDLGLISNGDGDVQRRKVEAIGLAPRFRITVISEDIGKPKPARELFEEAAKQAGRELKDCLYVGDRLRVDALAAENAGMTGIWLDRTGKSNGTEGVRVIKTLDPEILAAL